MALKLLVGSTSYRTALYRWLDDCNVRD